jgi:hypothetical protein
MFEYRALKFIIESITVAVIATFFVVPLVSRIFAIDESSYSIIFLTTFTTFLLYKLYYEYQEHKFINEIATVINGEKLNLLVNKIIPKDTVTEKSE